MKSTVQQISGNAFSVSLIPETEEEVKIMEAGTDQDKIGRYYQAAIREKLGEHIEPASLTPHDVYPYSATVELTADSGSV